MPDITVFDSADYLDTAEAITAYFDAWLEDESLAELYAALETVARANGVNDLARRSGVTRAGIYKALGEEGNPSFETIRAILGAMGLRLTVEAVGQEQAAA